MGRSAAVGYEGISAHCSVASVVMQLTLLEEYAVALNLARLSREKNMPLWVPLRTPDWAINPQAINLLPADNLGIRVV